MTMTKVFKDFYLRLIRIGNFLKSFLLLAIRLYWGIGFFYAGFSKLTNMSPVIVFFSDLGIPFPAFSSYLTAYIEAIGGLCLILGFASRLVCIPLIFTMIVAFLTAGLPAVLNVFNKPDEFVSQSPFNFLLASLIVFVFGPGGISVDFLIQKFFVKSK